MHNFPFDIVVYGATSFVGQIMVEYLTNHLRQYPEENISWALGGRSKNKLEKMRASIPGAEHVPLIIADAEDEDALRGLCEQTRVVLSTVGPYALYGTTLVKVCAETGTDYCDLAGEVQWIRRMIDRFEPQAKKTGARIVHCCGFDSIPSDLGVAFLQKKAQAKFGQGCSDIHMRVKAARGGASGGTLASIMNVVKEAVSNPSLRKELANPYSLCPPDHSFTVRQKSQKGIAFDKDFQTWSAPFFMDAINIRVVHRSNALSDNSYGQNFSYKESLLTGRGIKGRLLGAGIVAGLGAFLAGAAIKPARWFLGALLPKPGEGPSPEAQNSGFYDMRFIGRMSDGSALHTRVTGDKDPGYGSTSQILVQSGLCLALDMDKDMCSGGFWTPATVFDERIFQRLSDYAGMTFDVIDE